jgi:hypothetical protein
MQKKPYTVTHHFANGIIIEGRLQSGQVMIPDDSKFYEWYADLVAEIRKRGSKPALTAIV